jgi:KipI family sensor histidine kinase inhibitor
VLAISSGKSLDIQRRIRHVAREARAWDGIVDAVCGDANLTLIARPDIDFASAELRLREAWAAPFDPQAESHRIVEIPVRYGGDAGPDLAFVAARAGLSERGAVELHVAGEYTVAFLGFLPGFAYLDGLDATLATPRRETPRVAVPRGSVAIGGRLTAVYPNASPGGWHLIGSTALELFSAARSPAALLAPGDRVRFVSIR